MRKNVVDPKKAPISYYNTLSSWCANNSLFVRSNHEVFFINERVLIRPEFIINERVYVDILDETQITEKYLGYCELFAKSYGTIILIPKNIIDNIKFITKKDLQDKFLIKF